MSSHPSKIYNCCINGQIEVNGVLYANLASAKTAYPSGFVDCFSATEPGFNNPSNYDFSLQSTSPLIGSGYLNVNIGRRTVGLTYDKNSTFLNSGATFTNAGYNAEDELVVQNGGVSGTIVSGIRDIGRVATLGRLATKGISDFLNHVPDSLNTSDRPNKLSIEMRYAGVGEDITAKGWKHFLFTEIPCLDGTGKSNAESGFSWTSPLTIKARYVQFRVTLRNDYISV